MLQILQRYHAGSQVDGPPQVTVERDLNRLFALCLSQRFSPAGFAFPTYNFGCALMGDIFLDQDLVQNCVS